MTPVLSFAKEAQLRTSPRLGARAFAGHGVPVRRMPVRWAFVKSGRRVDASARIDSAVDTGLAWYKAQAEKPAFLAVELVLALAFLALLDGGLSGDWYKYDIINAEQQQQLRDAAVLGGSVHILMALYAGKLASDDGKNVVVIVIAGLKGFFFGTPEFVLNVARARSRSSLSP